MTAVRTTVSLGVADMTETLIEHGVNLEARAENKEQKGFTALHIAIAKSDFEMTKLLLIRGADITATSTYG